jgi:hypothetical protein
MADRAEIMPILAKNSSEIDQKISKAPDPMYLCNRFRLNRISFRSLFASVEYCTHLSLH